MKKKLYLTIALVENNPYDRAVIDAALSADEALSLVYSSNISGKICPLGPRTLSQLFNEPASSPKIVLFDLALDRKSEESLASSRLQKALLDEKVSNLTIPLTRNTRAMREFMIHSTVELSRILKSRDFKDLPTEADKLRSRATSLEVNDLPEVQRAFVHLDQPGGEGGAVSFDKMINSYLKELWGKRSSAVRLAREISEAPSLWFILDFIATHPDVCFFIISHYSNPNTKSALTHFLGCRNVIKAPDFAALYGDLILSKSDLGDLPGAIRRGYRSWKKRASLTSYVAPFGRLPVVVPSQTYTTLVDMLTAWREIFLNEEPGSCIVLSDETQWLSGFREATAASNRYYVWSGVPQRWGVRIAIWDGEVKELPTEADYIALVPETIRREHDAVSLAREISSAVARRSRFHTFFILGGESPGIDKLYLELEDNAKFYRVPGLDHKLELRKTFLGMFRPKTSWETVLSQIVSDIPFVIAGERITGVAVGTDEGLLDSGGINEVRCQSLDELLKRDDPRRPKKEILRTISDFLKDSRGRDKWDDLLAKAPLAMEALLTENGPWEEIMFRYGLAKQGGTLQS